LETKVSIVIPAYNGGDLLIRTLDSLCCQTFSNFEIIVVDDGSTDDTALRLAQYAEKEPRLRCFTVPNGGPARARNFGIEQARGEYLYLCDADDLSEPILLERLVKEMDRGVQLAACGFIQEQEADGKIKSSTEFRAEAVQTESNVEFLRVLPGLMQKQLMYVNWNKMYRMDIVRREKITFPEKYASCEDRLFNLAYFPFVDHFSFLSECLFHYYVRGDSSLVSRFLPSKYESLEQFDSTLNRLYEQNNLLTPEVQAVNARIFVKGVVACLISLHHPSCKLNRSEKHAFLLEMLRSDSLKNALAHLSGGISYQVIGLVLKTKSPVLANMLGGIAGFAAKKLPSLIQKIKHRN
jgi:glycosyltransferase involved in cell wall biosynthesis